MNYVCMGIKKYFHIKGFALNFALKQRLKITRKWPNPVPGKFQEDRTAQGGGF